MSLSVKRITRFLGTIVFLSLAAAGGTAILRPGTTFGFASHAVEGNQSGTAPNNYPYTEVLRGGSVLADDRTGAIVGVEAVFAGGSNAPFAPELRSLGTIPTSAYVRSARFMLESSGAYTGTEELSIEVRGLDGTVKWTISETPIDIVVRDNLVWVDVALSEDAARNTVSPNDYVAAKVTRGGEPGGDFYFEIATEVVVSNAPPNTTFLPAVQR